DYDAGAPRREPPPGQIGVQWAPWWWALPVRDCGRARRVQSGGELMIPTRRALAEMALRRQEELSRQLSSAHARPGGSRRPDVLRRAIVTVSVCHETLRTLQEATENGSKSASHHVPSAASGGGGWRQRGRYGFVADSAAIGGPRTLQGGDGWRGRRAHPGLAPGGALLAFSGPPWRSARPAREGGPPSLPGAPLARAHRARP